MVGLGLFLFFQRGCLFLFLFLLAFVIQIATQYCAKGFLELGCYLIRNGDLPDKDAPDEKVPVQVEELEKEEGSEYLPLHPRGHPNAILDRDLPSEFTAARD